MEVRQTSPENQSYFTLLQVRIIIDLFKDFPIFTRNRGK